MNPSRTDVEHLEPSRFLTRCVATLALVWSGWAGAVTFEPISQSRSVKIYAELDAFNFETRERDSAIFNDSAHSLPDGWDPLQMGMDIDLMDNCFGQGAARQSFTARAQSMHFEGLADVNISGFGNYPVMFEGSGVAVVTLDYRFLVSDTQSVDLFMDSEVGMYRDGDYTFSLSTVDGHTVWSSVGVVDEEGEATRSFSRRFTLMPAEYVIKATLRATSALSDGYSSAGRTWAQFSVSAVPEPDALYLAALGVGMVWLGQRYRRS